MTTFLLLSMMLSGAGGEKTVVGDEWVINRPAPRFKAEELKADGKIAITLRNRASIASTQDFGKGGETVTVSFNFILLKGDGAYQDDLAVVLRTDGIQRQQWSYEMLKGILVRFSPTAGEVQISRIKGVDHEGIARKGTEMKMRTEYKVRIVDTGERVSVSVDDVVVLDNILVTPDASDRHYKVALYNREPVAGTEHEAVITNLRIEVKK